MRKPARLWNGLLKPESCDELALSCDIVASVRSMWCLCQRTNGFNNIIAFRKRGYARNTSNVADLFGFLYYLKRYYGVEYVRIEGEPKKYRLLTRLFDTAVKKDEAAGRDVFYLMIDGRAERKLHALFWGRVVHDGRQFGFLRGAGRLPTDGER